MIAFEDLDGSHFEEWGLDTYPHPSRVLGYACRRDDELVALGFVVVDEDNRWWGSFGSRGRFPAKSVHQKTLELFAALDRAGVPEILAVADPEVARSREWLTRLGFEPGENEVWKRGISGSNRRVPC